MQTKKDQSFGIIPIKKFETEWKVFLINQFSKIGNNTYWVFPKGHPEGSEDPLETARRELKEETDMETATVIKSPTFELAYSFVFSDTKIEKTVSFYLGIIESDSFVLDPVEVKEGGWYSLDEAMKRLDYKDTKNMFQEVKQYLDSNQITY